MTSEINMETIIADQVDRELYAARMVKQYEALPDEWGAEPVIFSPVGLEARADALWEAAVTSTGDRGMGLGPGETPWPEELVALGLVYRVTDGRFAGDTQCFWHELENSAPTDSLTFAVSGTDVHAALTAARAVRGEPLYGLLWHSHYRSQQPSRLDIRAFPKWYARVGIVYHAPTRSSCAYNESGLISEINSLSTRTTEGR